MPYLPNKRQTRRDFTHSLLLLTLHHIDICFCLKYLVGLSTSKWLTQKTNTTNNNYVKSTVFGELRMRVYSYVITRDLEENWRKFICEKSTH